MPIVWRWAAYGLAFALAACQVAEAQEVREAYDLHSMVAQGRVQGNNAELTFDFRADTLTDKPVRIPLRLDECIITSKKFTGPDSQSLTLKDAGRPGGYAWHLPGKVKGCRLTLTVLVPLKVVAGEDQLVFTAPQQKQSESVLTLLVPGDVELGEVLGGEHPTDPAKQRGNTEFTFRRLSGQFTCSWHPREKLIREAGQLRSRLFIKSRYEATNRQFHSEVQVTVMSFGGKFRQTQLRLPPGAALVKSNPKWTTIEKAAEGAADRGDLVTVRHEPATRYSLSLELVHPFDPGTRQPVQLAAFQVHGALRQWGYLALEYDGRSQVRWGSLNTTHIDRIAVADLPKEFSEQLNLIPDDARAAFELFSDKASLAARGFRTSPRIRIEPEYIVVVHRDRLHLEAVYQVTVDRAPASQFKIELPAGEDWQIERVGPEQVVGPHVVDPPPGIPQAKSVKRTVTIDLKSNMTGSFRINLSAERRFEGEADSVAFRLPQPLGGRVVNPRLWVQAANNVVLQPPADPPATLSEQALPPQRPEPIQTADPKFKQRPWFYHMTSAAARFTAGLTLRGRQLTVRASGNVTVQREGLNVVQKFAYTLEHAPLRELAFDLPETLKTGQLTFYLDDVLVDAPEFIEPMDEDAMKTANGRANIRRLKLPEEAEPGDFTLRIEHVHAWSPAGAGHETITPLSVPLVMPAEASLVENTMHIEVKSRLSIQLAATAGATKAKQLWQHDEADSTTRPDRLALRAARSVSVLALEIRPAAPVPESRLIVDQLWVQTWVLDHRRVDRWACRFSGGGSTLRVRLPQGVGGIKTVLDGRALSLTPDEHNVLTVPLGPVRGPQPDQHLLRVDYQMPAAEGAVASLTVAQLAQDAWVNRTQWQLILPEDQHLVASPENMTREFAWQWQRGYWSRISSDGRRAQGEASKKDDRGKGASKKIVAERSAQQLQAVGLEPPPALTNHYLFSTLGPPPLLRVVVAARTSLLLGASGIVFLLGALLLNVPVPRRGWVLAVAALGLLLVGLIFPETALVAAQAASLGLVAVLLMAGLRWLLTVTRPIAPRLAGSSTAGASAILETGSTQRRTAEPMSAANGSGALVDLAAKADSVAAAGGDAAS